MEGRIGQLEWLQPVDYKGVVALAMHTEPTGTWQDQIPKLTGSFCGLKKERLL